MAIETSINTGDSLCGRNVAGSAVSAKATRKPDHTFRISLSAIGEPVMLVDPHGDACVAGIGCAPNWSLFLDPMP